MICKSCAEEADRGGPIAPDAPHCAVCDRVTYVYRSDVAVEDQRVYRHNWQGERCSGSSQPPIYKPTLAWGHAACKGCDCQHAPTSTAATE